MIYLQAAIALHLLFFLVLGLALVIGVPVGIYIITSRDKKFAGYSFFQKLIYVLTLAAGLIIAFFTLVFLLFSMVNTRYT